MLTEDDDRALGRWLADPDRPKALHDAKGPIHALAARGMTVAGLTSDTALALTCAARPAHVQPGRLALRYLAGSSRRDVASGQLTWTCPTGRGRERALPPRRWPPRSWPTRWTRPGRRGATELLAEVELPLVSVLAEMEQAGIAADVDHSPACRRAWAARSRRPSRRRTRSSARVQLARPSNCRSPVHRARPAQDQADQDGLHTDSEALTGLLAETGHPVLEHLLRHGTCPS